MADVGKLAGVSACTVSRAFNSPETVRPQILEKVHKAAKELNYSLNPAAKALRLQQTHIFGVIIPTLNHAMFAELVNSFQSTLSESGYAPVIITTGFDNRNIFDHIRAIVERGAEGLLMVGRVEDPRVREFIERSHLPVVTTYSYLEDESIPSIGFDNYQSARQSVDYLLALGHTKIAMIAGPSQGNDRQQSRIQAFRDAREMAGIKEEWPVVENAYDSAYASGANVMHSLLVSHPDLTAVVCSSDTFAIGALQEAKRMGLRVPEDVSIIGHDDFELAQLLDPALSTVKVPAAEMGKRCAEALLNAKVGNNPIVSRKLNASLILRDSAAPPKTKTKAA
ncbi:substrate-binding domain-containing protein [Croceicoccus bisphenolivorans]|uniref:LacI family DNA-binding transcriptional regulator n=1 Tax=Croceicoccus bisphenolivorans TaxID=1783232 RepID=UPI0015602ECD|nr:substrate-binding domain-containing protein [Croceicoccus bisphenolivorans]